MVERMEMNVGMLWLAVVVDCCIAWRGGGSRQRDLVDVLWWCVCGSVHVPYYVLLAAFNKGITHDGPVNGLYCDMFTG